MSVTHFSGPVHRGISSIATAAGTTTLDKDAKGLQVFTGSTTQTILMPAANVVGAGYEVKFINLSSGTITIQDNSAGAITTVAGSAAKTITCITAADAAGTWSAL